MNGQRNMLLRKGVNLPVADCNHETAVKSEQEIEEMFLIKKDMKVFDWQAPNYEKDTIMTVMDSIRYYKNLVKS